MKPSRGRAELALAAVCLIWGSTFVLIKSALDDISTLLFLALRFSIAAMVLAGIYAVRRRSWQLGGWRTGMVVGGFLFIGFFFQTLGLRFTTAAKSGFITGLSVVLVPLLSALVYKRAPRIAEWIGVLLASAGLGLMTLDPSSLQMGKGDLLTVGCAVAFAVHILLLGHYSPRMESDWLTLLQISACALFAWSTFGWVEAPYVRWSGIVVMAIAIASVLATALAFWVMTWAQKYTSPTRAALIFTLEPVFAWLTAYLVAGEKLTGHGVAGAACILVGILLVELKPAPSRSHQNP
jgi:drug/metabolite transporter (DMT)-like permease